MIVEENDERSRSVTITTQERTTIHERSRRILSFISRSRRFRGYTLRSLYRATFIRASADECALFRLYGS